MAVGKFKPYSKATLPPRDGGYQFLVNLKSGAHAGSWLITLSPLDSVDQGGAPVPVEFMLSEPAATAALAREVRVIVYAGDKEVGELRPG